MTFQSSTNDLIPPGCPDMFYTPLNQLFLPGFVRVSLVSLWTQHETAYLILQLCMLLFQTVLSPSESNTTYFGEVVRARAIKPTLTDGSIFCRECGFIACQPAKCLMSIY